MFFLDHVLRACHDQNGHCQLGQFDGIDMWLVDHQAEHFGILFGFFGFLGKQLCDVIADFDGPLVASLHA